MKSLSISGGQFSASDARFRYSDRNISDAVKIKLSYFDKINLPFRQMSASVYLGISGNKTVNRRLMRSAAAFRPLIGLAAEQAGKNHTNIRAFLSEYRHFPQFVLHGGCYLCYDNADAGFSIASAIILTKQCCAVCLSGCRAVLFASDAQQLLWQNHDISRKKTDNYREND